MMPSHVDILDQQDRLGKPLAGSVVLHVLCFAVLLFWGVVLRRNPVSWGSPNSGGPGSIAINVVNKIPLPQRSGIVNPVANNTESIVPAPPPAPKPQRSSHAAELDAIAIPTHSKIKPSPVDRSEHNTWRDKQVYRPNQLYSQSGPALVSPMIGQVGSGGVGVGLGTPFGNRFGNYVMILRQRVAEKWQTSDVDARIRTAPPVVVTFDLLRNGTVRDVRIEQRSGNALLDASAQRAIYDASPFPPLPAEYDRNDAVIEFWFELKR